MEGYIKEVVNSITPQLIDWRRELHRYPEVGFQEYKTATFIEEALQAMGLMPRRVAGTGVVVDIEGNQPGPVRAFRADIDALPIQEIKPEGVSYISCHPGVAHLCGHDAHTAIGLGIAYVSAKLKDALAGTIRVFFQPAEEPTPSGAPQMIQAGVLEQVTYLYAVHVDPSLPVGVFGFREGALNAAIDTLSLTVQGEKTVHSSRPHEGQDTPWILHQIVNSWYQIVGRVHDVRHPAVWVMTYMKAGGDALNVIPDEATVGGTLRTTNPADRQRLEERFKAVADALAEAYGTKAEVTVHRGAPPVMNHPDLIRHVRALAIALWGSSAVYDIPMVSMGGEDFAYYLEHVPGAMIRVGVASTPETRYKVHDARFDLDERALPLAVELMSNALFKRPEWISEEN